MQSLPNIFSAKIYILQILAHDSTEAAVWPVVMPICNCVSSEKEKQKCEGLPELTDPLS